MNKHIFLNIDSNSQENNLAEILWERYFTILQNWMIYINTLVF